MKRNILVLDTTLRDGEQVPGAKLNKIQKLSIAKQLVKLNVDIIEAGFPSSSRGDFEAVSEIAKKIKGPQITALARAVESDIYLVYESIRHAERGMIHIVLGSSDVHVNGKFKKSRESVLEMGVNAVRYAKKLYPQVQYSTEDAGRSDFEYLWKTVKAVINAGATVINIADTVGYSVPEEFGELIKKIKYRMKNLNPEVILSVHCHNDTGLATANTLAAVKNGAEKVECTINGIGERAGNAALEEVIMGLRIRPEYYNADTRINSKEIINTSQMVSDLMGLKVQVNKAITGGNAFSHSSGIHQDGLLKSKNTYEIINPRDVGLDDMKLVLTARSGRHAFKKFVEEMGHESYINTMSALEFEKLFEDFLNVADSKKEVRHEDIQKLINV
jgi:2-isopropylmalate synthase